MEKKGPFWEKLPDLTHSKHKGWKRYENSSMENKERK